MSSSKYILIQFLFMLITCYPLGAETGTLNNKPRSDRKYQILFGINYSNYVTTDGHGNTGTYLGFYRKREIGRSFGLKYGFSYTIKKAYLLDKKLRSDDFNDGTTLWTSDILGNFHFAEFNSIVNYIFLNGKLLCIKSFFGIGYAINIRYGTEIRNKSVIKDDHKPFEIYDYRFANESVPPFFANVGYVLHGGFEIERGRYIFNFIYSYNLFYLRRATHLLSFGDPGEKLRSVALIIGIGI